MHTKMVILRREVSAIGMKGRQRARDERSKLATAIKGLREAKFSAIVIVTQRPHFQEQDTQRRRKLETFRL